MKKLTKLLALALAAVMLLPVTALAAENPADDGPKLVVCGLDWNEGHFVRDDDLSGRNYGGEEAYVTPGDEWAVIFFAIGEDGKRTPVIPEAGKGVTIRKLEKDEIASGAKQSQYYVCIRIDDWNETEVTSGKAVVKVIPQLPDVGFYATAEATQAGYLSSSRKPVDPSRLTDNTVYFVRQVFDDPNQRQIKELKKGSNGSPNMYDLEKVGDNVWKITLKIPEGGGAGVNLDVTWQEADGSTYNEERGCGFEYPHGPELWNHYLEGSEEMGIYLPEGNDNGYGFNICPGDTFIQIFYKCDYDDKGNQTFTPVPASELKGSDGLTITPLEEGESKDKLAGCFVWLSVADWNKTYTISAGEYTAKLTSNLPDIGIYSKPELTTDSFLHNWNFSPTVPNETVYIGSYIPEGDDRFLADLKLAKFENSDQFTLEKYNDDFYKLTRKSLDAADMTVEFEGAWGWPDGNTEPMQAGIWLESLPALLAGESAPEIIDRDHPIKYSDWKDNASDKLTLAAGESKDFQVCFTFFTDVNGAWTMGRTSAWGLRANDSKLKITTDDTDYAKMTLSCDVPGTYTLKMHSIYPDIKAIYHADGTKYTAEELREFDENTGYELTRDQKQVMVYNEEHETGALFEEAFPGEKIEFEVVDEEIPWYPITVTVAGEAAKPAFTDVTANAWYAPAVSYANGKGYMKGNSETTFNPTGRIKGSEFAQILYNKEGKPAAAEGAAFQGVADQWYAPAILWAAGKGVVADTGDAAVVPEADLTREQIALMLYNYMGKPEAKGDVTAFTDASKVSAWAADAMAWAVGEGVLKGSDNALNPTGTATRAETAQILMNFFK